MGREGAVGLGLALVAGYGVFLLHTAVAFRWSGVALGPRLRSRRSRRDRWRERLAQAGLADVRPVELVAVALALGAVGGALAFVLLGTAAAPAGTLAAAALPVAAARARRERRRAAAAEAWPRMIEEIRLQATTMGRSVPQALLDVGLRGSAEMRPAFAAAQREWLVSTDFARTTAVLKERLADPTADMVCETLLVSQEVGGADLDGRLAALAEDRAQDLRGRKDARSKQAGARFARAFVVVVPLGMAAAGWTIGEGRAAYETAAGRLAVLVGVAVMALCWVWASRIMRLPQPERVFHG